MFFAVKQVFKDLAFLGWYTTGTSLTESDMKIHNQICGISEIPIFLKLNPQGASTDVRYLLAFACPKITVFVYVAQWCSNFLARGPHLSFRNPSGATRINNLDKNSLKSSLK